MATVSPSLGGVSQVKERDPNSVQLRTHVRRLVPVVVLCALVCAGFAAMSSCAILYIYLRGDFVEAAGFGTKLFIKVAFFSGMSLLCAGYLLRMRPSIVAASPEDDATDANPWIHRATLLFSFLLAAVLLLPNLDRHPWAAPDELHHLIVARNLAKYEAYASGHPNEDLVYFDHYSSVGAPVLVPIAGAFKIGGVTLANARSLIVASYFLLLAFSYLVLRRPFGNTAAACGTIMMTLSFGSVYLGRTLYGEVPALMFLMAGLWVWGKSLNNARATLLPLVAGICFGLAVLTKTFLMVGVWAVIGMWIYDRLTHRQIALRNVLCAATGMMGAMGAWAVVEFINRNLIAEAPSTLLYYRHSFLFGFDALPKLIAEFSTHALPVIAGTVVFLYVASILFEKRYDPPSIVLYLTAILFFFWWVFFTPARIPRYLWYSCAIMGLLSGPLLVEVAGRLFAGASAPRLRLASGLCALLLIGLGLQNVLPQFGRIYRDDQGGADYALSAYVSDLPADARVATTYWPTERVLNFMTERSLDVLGSEDVITDEYDVVVYSDHASPIPQEVLDAGQRMGHYVVFSRIQEKETEL